MIIVTLPIAIAVGCKERRVVMRKLAGFLVVLLLCGCATHEDRNAGVSFAPAMERVLPFGVPCAMQYFQFHTGNVIAIGDGPGDTLDHAEEYAKAEESGGLDASAIGSVDDGIQLVGQGCIFTRDHSPDWDTTTAEEVVESWIHASWIYGVVEPRKKDFPITYFFKTARGECGILQILGVTKIPGSPVRYGMKFRYKLVMPKQ
jgi:hypothetical protein